MNRITCFKNIVKIRPVKYLALFFLIGILLFSCNGDQEEILPAENFVRIYDDARFSASYLPIDIIQTTDEGFLILSGSRQTSSNFVGTQILKTDSEGNYITLLNLPEGDVQPIANWTVIGGEYYFFCMDATNLATKMFRIDQQLNILNSTMLNTSYPMAVSQDNDRLLLLSYDNESKNSILSLLDENGNTLQQKSFSIGAGDGVEEPIIDHFTRTGRQFPFQTGKTGDGIYFFNGFYNYTFSLVFTDLTGEEPKGIVQGQQDDGGISAILPLAGSGFALSRFNFGDNVVVSNVQLNTGEIISSINLNGNAALEWVPDARVDIKRINHDRDLVVFGSTTQNSQIMISIYDTVTGEWLGNKYFGYSTPYFLQRLNPTVDGGIALLGSTAVAGRFNRICLFKLSSAEISDISNQMQN
jgi:hypothetical protein